MSVPPALRRPRISLLGEVGEPMAAALRDQLRGLGDNEGDVAVELTTLGGDAELARRMVLDLTEARRRIAGRLLFLGKTVVYSAGATIMSAFARADRFLTADAVLMIHCRQLDKTVEISGPIRGSLPQVEALKAQLRTGIDIEERNFRRLIEGSNVSLDELNERALHNWYLTAGEALARGLVAGVLDVEADYAEVDGRPGG